MDIECRKCQTPNPSENQFCRKCGAVLRVSTTQIRAQRVPVAPADKRFKWRYVFLGGLVMLGIAALALVIAFFLGLKSGFGDHGLVGGLLMFTVTIGAVFVVSFGISGALLSLIASRAVSRESFVAAALVVSVLGVIGSSFVFDLLVTAGVLIVPTSVAAWIGARFWRST